MKKILLMITMLALLISPAYSKNYGDATFLGSVELPNSITLPATCTVGEVYIDSDATTKARLYTCESTDTWVVVGAAAGAGTGDLLADGTIPLTADWDVGLFDITAVEFKGALIGNSSTSTALAANGANCSAGYYPLGVDASGAVESCTAVGEATVDESVDYDWTGVHTFATTVTHSGTGATIFNNSKGATSDFTIHGDTVDAVFFVDVSADRLYSEGNAIDFGDTTDGYVLTYNTETQDWTGQLGGTGSGATTSSGGVTYATSVTDDFAIGGVDNTAPFFFDYGDETLTLTSSDSTATISATNGVLTFGSTVSVENADGVSGITFSGTTSDPCGTLGEGAIFYNTTDNVVCFCDDTNDLLIYDTTTGCF